MSDAGWRVALATNEELAELEADDLLLAQALRARGAHVEPAVWDAAQVDWRRFDAVMVRSTWGYFEKIDAFVAWLERLDALARAGDVVVFNPPVLMLANTDKRYLLALAQRGVTVLPTAVVQTGDAAAARAELERLLAQPSHAEAVFKPAVSAGAYLTERVRAPLDDATAERFCAIAAGVGALVQPFAPEIASAGELSLIFIDGALSHAVRKRAAAGDFRIQEKHGGTVEAVSDVDASLREAGEEAIAAAVASVGGERPPLYARVDGIERDGTLALMELELIEPSLFFAADPGGAERCADALLARLDGSRR